MDPFFNIWGCYDCPFLMVLLNSLEQNSLQFPTSVLNHLSNICMGMTGVVKAYNTGLAQSQQYLYSTLTVLLRQTLPLSSCSTWLEISQLHLSKIEGDLIHMSSAIYVCNCEKMAMPYVWRPCLNMPRELNDGLRWSIVGGIHSWHVTKYHCSVIVNNTGQNPEALWSAGALKWQDTFQYTQHQTCSVVWVQGSIT